MAKKVLSGKDNTNGFQKNPQNINRTGLNRKGIKTINSVNKDLENKGFEVADGKQIHECYLRLINISLGALTEMVNDKEQPALIRVIGKAILGGKGFDVIERMLNRTIGTATQTIESNISVKDFDLSKMVIFKD